MYEYAVEVLKVVDGDTVDVRIDLGFKVHKVERVRLAGLDTPELTSSDPAERARAKEAKAYVEAALAGAAVRVRSEKPLADDKYGRYLATISFRAPDAPAWRILNDELLACGLAKPYSGGART